jgi:protein-S-isoprenylcysteine O-methyltransferase Ste14
MPSLNKLVIPTLRSFLIGVVILGLLLFLPAWTLNYWQAWVFIVVFTTSVNAIGVYLSLNDPELLERRKQVGPVAEQTVAQKIIISIAFLSLIVLFIFSGFDHRFGWSSMPPYVSWIGDMLVALGLFINVLVFKENRYGASTVQVFEGQKVISTGPYALVRHPMYSGVLVMVVGIPMALGSWWGLLILVLTLPILIWRILDEEKLLKQDLPGYKEYAQKVRYRLVPNLW